MSQVCIKDKTEVITGGFKPYMVRYFASQDGVYLVYVRFTKIKSLNSRISAGLFSLFNKGTSLI